MSIITARFRSKGLSPEGYCALFSLMRPQVRRLGGAALCMGISAAATAFYAYLVGPMLRCLFLDDAVMSPRPLSSGELAGLSDLSGFLKQAGPSAVGLAIIAVAAVKAAAFFGQAALTGKAGADLLYDLRRRLFGALVRSNPLAEGALTSGDLVARFTVDAEQVEGAVTRGVAATLRHGAEILALAGLAVTLDPHLALLGLVAFPPAAAVIIRVGKRLKHQRRALHDAIGELGTAIDETRAGLPVIRAFAAEPVAERRFDRHSRRIRRSSVRALLLKAASSPFNEILGAAALAGTLVYATVRIGSGSLTPESFISFFTALFLLYQPVKGIGQAHHAVQAGRAALARLAVLDTPPPLAGTRRRTGPPRVTLRHVDTGYPPHPPVLRDITLDLPPGDTVAVVGPSGSGKTTLLNLLEGLIPPTSGEIRVDGEPVTLSSTPELCAPVRQEPFLFDDTLRMNVRIGREDATDEEIEAACRAAGVMSFANGLPEGLDSPVGSGGRALSVGQRQRICLARAIISRAPLLLLDEVTASLDGETERSLVEGLDALPQDRTVVVVTHRLSTAMWARRLVLLEAGEIRADGPSGELIPRHRRVAEVFGDQRQGD